MTGSLGTETRRTRLLLIAILGALALGGTAQGSIGQGAAPQSATDAASANWAAKAKLLDANGRPQFDQFPPLPSIDAASANWAAKAKLLDANNRPLSGVSSGSTRFDWGGFGVGGAALLGLALLAIGLLAGAHHRRQAGAPPRPAAEVENDPPPAPTLDATSGH